MSRNIFNFVINRTTRNDFKIIMLFEVYFKLVNFLRNQTYVTPTKAFVSPLTFLLSVKSLKNIESKLNYLEHKLSLLKKLDSQTLGEFIFNISKYKETDMYVLRENTRINSVEKVKLFNLVHGNVLTTTPKEILSIKESLEWMYKNGYIGAEAQKHFENIDNNLELLDKDQLRYYFSISSWKLKVQEAGYKNGFPNYKLLNKLRDKCREHYFNKGTILNIKYKSLA